MDCNISPYDGKRMMRLKNLATAGKISHENVGLCQVFHKTFEPASSVTLKITLNFGCKKW